MLFRFSIFFLPNSTKSLGTNVTNSGFNPSYYSDSVGLINKAYCIRQAIDDGRQTFDFLRGAERYKYDLGAENRSLFEIVARR